MHEIGVKDYGFTNFKTLQADPELKIPVFRSNLPGVTTYNTGTDIAPPAGG